MTTNLWPARAARLQAIAEAMRPSWARRISGVASRLTKPDCWKCGGENYVHSHSCKFALRGVASGSTRIAFGNAVEKAAAKHALHLERAALFAKMKALAKESGLWAAIQARTGATS